MIQKVDLVERLYIKTLINRKYFTIHLIPLNKIHYL